MATVFPTAPTIEGIRSLQLPITVGTRSLQLRSAGKAIRL